MKIGRVGSFVLIFVILFGFNASFIGAEGNGSLAEEVGALQDVGGQVSDVGEIEIEADIIYVDIDELVGEEDVEDNVSIEAGDNVTVEEVEGEVNSTVEVFENVSDDGEGNVTVEVNLSEGVIYVDIDELVGDVGALQDVGNQVSDVGGLVVEGLEEEVVTRSLVKDGKIEFEFEALENDDIEISKKELMLGELEKRVRISSDEHFDDEVRVYSDLPVESEEENIVIMWENEDEVVTDVEYFDEDGNGLIERVSWIVPHLSTQYYNIEIRMDGAGDAEVLNIVNVVSPNNNSVVGNPVVFDFDIDYVNLNEVKCFLYINKKSGILVDINSQDFPLELSGDINWSLECHNDTSGPVVDSISGFFTVQGSLLNVDVANDFYLSGDGTNVEIVSNGNITKVELERPNGDVVHLKNVSGVSGSAPISSDQMSAVGNYKIIATSYYFEEPVVYVENFSVGSIDVNFDSSVNESDDVDFVITMDNVPWSIYDLYVGSEKIETGSDDQTISAAFEEGTYDIELRNIRINGESYGVKNFGSIEVVSTDDSDGPDVDLGYPAWEEIVRDEEIIFEYSVDDDSGIDRCEFFLYNTSQDSSGVYETDELLFPLNSNDENLAHDSSIVKDEDIEIRLVDFDEGDYIWEVRCYDEFDNEGWDFNYFSVDIDGNGGVVTSSGGGDDYERKEEVEGLIDSINEFLEREDDYGIEELDALDVLGISSDMGFYKKRLVQIDQDLKFNLKFMAEDKRVIRIDEINSEIDEMKEGIVLDIEVTGSYEYSKNSLDVFMIDVLEDYMEATGTNIGRSALKSLAKYSEELQREMNSEIEVFKVEIKYLSPRDDPAGPDEVKEVVLVSKEFDISGGHSEILEILPSRISEDVVFLSLNEEITPEIYKIDVRDLEDDRLVYYFSPRDDSGDPDDDFDLEDIEETESILFDENGDGDGGVSITGYFIGVGDDISFGSLFFPGIVLFVGFVGFLIFGKIRMEGWKKNPNVSMIFDLVYQTRTLVKENRVEDARANYLEMGRVYKLLPRKPREFFYKEIEKIQLAINKKDVLNLLREYERAKSEFRKEDSIELHRKINEIYKKLPPKFQEKVYQRLVKREI